MGHKVKAVIARSKGAPVEVVEIDVVALGDVDEHGLATGMGDGAWHGSERERVHEYLVATANAGRDQRSGERRTTAVERHAVATPDEFSELGFEQCGVGLIAASGLVVGAIYAAGSTDGPLMGAAIFVHETSVTLSYIMIAIHVTAAIYHRVKGDGIWSAMVPVFKEK